MSVARIHLNNSSTVENLIKELIAIPEKRIILDVAKDATLLNNEINLRLLKFYAEEEEKEIIINSTDVNLVSIAQKFGISTVKDNQSSFSKIQPKQESPYLKADREVAASPEPDPEVSGSGWTQWHGGMQFAIIISMFSLILACWWFIQPRAVVIVYPKEQFLTFSTDAQISTAYSAGDLLNGELPAKNLEKDAQIKVQTVATGTKTIGVTAAVGRLTIINSTGQPVVLPKGSAVIGKAGVRFLTDQDVLVPKKYTKYQDGMAVGEEYGRIEVGITAEKKGAIGNQPAKSINIISGKYQRFLRVINLSPTRNGADKKVSVVTLDDVKKGEAEAKRQMKLADTEEVTTLTGNEYLYLPELVKSEIIRVVNSPDIGAESEVLQTTLEYRTSIITPLIDDVLKYLARRFEENIPAGFQAKNQRVELITYKSGIVRDGFAKLILTGRGSIKGMLDPKKIKSLIKGKSLKEANNSLTGQNEIARFKIDLKNGSGYLPRHAFQIKLVFPAGGRMR